MADASVRIPTRFESILANEALDPDPLLIPVEPDLAAFDRLRQTADLQAGGVLAFLTGASGVGKTTAAYAAVTFLSDRLARITLVPHDVPLRDVDRWLATSLPTQEDRSQLVLFDGREITDDAVGLRQLMSSLNQTLRRRPDVILIWPTTDPEWHAELREIAGRVGGETLVPPGADIEIQGPPRTDWIPALERLLIQFDRSLDDLALDPGTIEHHASQASNIGGFLQSIGSAIVQRIDQVQLAEQLPPVLFVVTSSSEVVGEANRLRRAESFLLGARELLGYSPRSRAGKWWRERLTNPSHHLAYIISLLRARLATMTPSSVAYACVEFGDEELRRVVQESGIRRNSSNSNRTFRNTDLYQLLSREPLSELTSTRKGRTARATETAFAAVQELSSRRHKVINQAILRLAGRNVQDLETDLATFEVHLGGRDLYADAVVPWGAEGDLYTEFHHLSPALCKASKIAAYVMEKLQYYAIHYNLVPR